MGRIQKKGNEKIRIRWKRIMEERKNRARIFYGTYIRYLRK